MSVGSVQYSVGQWVSRSVGQWGSGAAGKVLIPFSQAVGCSVFLIAKLEGEALRLMQPGQFDVDVEISPIKLARAGLLDIDDLGNRSLAEAGIIVKGHKVFAVAGQQPEPNGRDAGHLSLESAFARPE